MERKRPYYDISEICDLPLEEGNANIPKYCAQLKNILLSDKGHIREDDSPVTGYFTKLSNKEQEIDLNFSHLDDGADSKTSDICNGDDPLFKILTVKNLYEYFFCILKPDSQIWFISIVK